MELLKHVAKQHHKEQAIVLEEDEFEAVNNKDEDEQKINSEEDELSDNMLLKDLESKEFEKTQALSSENQCWMSLWTKSKSKIIKDNH